MNMGRLSMREIPFFGELLPPEYYHETQGYESRLAVLKLNDVLETLGDSKASLIYSDNEEQKQIEDSFEKNIVRRFHIRHAIIDLNNCYDLLLQVPWFFYRVWNDYNTSGKYHYTVERNYTDVIRNADNWVEVAEKACNYKRVYQFLSNHRNKNLNKLSTELEKFKDNYIFNENKPFTIRTLANSIKHNGSLKVKELCEPWNLNLKSGEKIIDPRKSNLNVEIKANFFSSEGNNSKPLGEIRAYYSDDLYVDIEYNGGEIFFARDYVRKGKAYPIEDLHKEAVNYFDNFINLFEEIYNNINPQLFYSPMIKKDNINISKESINLDKYFKINE